MVQRFKQFIQDSKAVSALEYAILIGVIAGAIALVIGQLGESVKDTIERAKTKVDQAQTKSGLKN